jgi:hypothetical protein
MIHVAWIPAWYQRDPSLEVGVSGAYAFWRVVPDHLRGPEPLVLYKETDWRPDNCIVATGTVAAIRHPELGAIHRVDTDRPDYTITLAEGTEVTVDSEERPGKLYEWGGEAGMLSGGGSHRAR